MIPRNVDLIIAGFACVDFSKLNTSGKAFGESSDTFLSILEYARKYSPAILILENVSGAPWDKFKAIWQDDKAWIRDIGRTTTSKTLRMNTAERKFFVNFWKSKNDAYFCEWVIVDTKEYYLPHTRKRGYMICLSKKTFGDSADAKKLVTTWRQIMGNLQQRASVSVEAILMADDDQRVSEAKDEFSKTAKDVRIETDWETCAAGYQDYREKKLYGIERPITNWINGGTAKAPDYWWPEWFSVQVARIWETFDVAYIRNVVKQYDSFFKV
jgi:site-specific DNA-cytosine methylase